MEIFSSICKHISFENKVLNLLIPSNIPSILLLFLCLEVLAHIKERNDFYADVRFFQVLCFHIWVKCIILDSKSKVQSPWQPLHSLSYEAWASSTDHVPLFVIIIFLHMDVNFFFSSLHFMIRCLLFVLKSYDVCTKTRLDEMVVDITEEVWQFSGIIVNRWLLMSYTMGSHLQVRVWVQKFLIYL